MQSESNEYSPYSTTSFEGSPTTPQHGLHSPAPGNQLALEDDPFQARPRGTVEPESRQWGDLDEAKRLNAVANADIRNQKHTAVEAIIEYENALLPASPKKEDDDGPVFKVIPSKPGRRNGQQLDQLPNEVLTHILSHLPATSLSAVSLVSKRFYSLVTTPHAWRIAFSRFFPGQDATDEDFASRSNRRGSDQQERDNIRAEQRFFTRLTALASWRSEYIIRTRLLRSLGRGKPQAGNAAKGSSGRASQSNNNANAAVTYNSQLSATVNHIHAVWNDGKKTPRFIHGTDETGHVSASDPGTGKVDNWSATDLQMHPQFVDVYPGAEQYGLGEGTVVGVPNTMDVSQPFGMVYGEGFPGGCAYYRHPEEKRGRVLAPTVEYEEHPADLPNVPTVMESITSVCIAKSSVIPNLTSGMVGILTGSSCGIITAYSAGLDKLEGHRLTRGEVTCRWAISPGVPIIALRLDDNYNEQRRSFGRVWAVAFNALGEVYYLDRVPDRPVQKGVRDTAELDELSWQTGRSVEWKLVQPTRRLAKEDPYQEPDFDGSYTPRSSPATANLSKNEIRAENRSIEAFFKHKPEYFRKNCQNWDMRRKLEVDFGGEDGHGAGENIVVVECGIGGEDAGPVHVQRFSRTKSAKPLDEEDSAPTTPLAAAPIFSSIFGGTLSEVAEISSVTPPVISFGEVSNGLADNNTELVEEWKTTTFAWPGGTVSEITTTAMDTSKYAILTAFEDPIMAATGGSRTSSSATSPSLSQFGEGLSLHDVPGYRARFIALGTKDGTIVLYNIRGGQPSNRPVPDLQPVRVITTDSPQISCLALSALYLVHGGNDGLVQAWDILASTTQPVRTLNSRFSSRARRRLVQAEASAQGVGINLFAAGAIALDTDPTQLRGIVSLGTHLRYWAYSSTAADEVSTKKRRLRRSSVRGQNGAADRYTNSGRGAIMDYIVNEQHELQAEKKRREAEKEHLHGRFGVGLAGLSEEEALAYAVLVSEEAALKEQERLFAEASARASPAPDAWTESTAYTAASPTPSPSRASASSAPTPRLKTEDELENDIEEAIRLSLLESSGGGLPSDDSPFLSEGHYITPPGTSGTYDVPFVVKQKKSRRSSPSHTSPNASPYAGSAKGKAKAVEQDMELDDLDYALELSLAEEESRKAAEEADVKGKGKGKQLFDGYRY